MVFITEEMVRKRSEHNEGEICSLEEVALHQEDIEKIEHLQNWCRELKILLLQSNLISKIENVHKLKKLEYLNLALNNIERIENLEGCESLSKLDLTLNFVGEITSVRSLRKNEFLRELYLTGNPCCDFAGYREYVIVTLPQLASLDGRSVEHSDRILASQSYEEISKTVLVEQRLYAARRQRQKEKSKGCVISEVDDSRPDEEKLQAYWSEVSEHCPETRVDIANAIRKSKEVKETPDPLQPPKRTYRFFADNGRPLNVNQAKLQVSVSEDEERNCLVLDVPVYKHLDTAHIELDVQPTYARILVKGKALQVVFSEEVMPDASTAQRSSITGHLIVTMPRARGLVKPRAAPGPEPVKPRDSRADSEPAKHGDGYSTREFLEIGMGDNRIDLSRIVAKAEEEKKTRKLAVNKKDDEDFIDDPEVPPLEG